MADQKGNPDQQDLHTPERDDFYRDMENRKKIKRYTFAITFDVDEAMLKADIPATIHDALKNACLKPIRVKKLPNGD